MNHPAKQQTLDAAVHQRVSSFVCSASLLMMRGRKGRSPEQIRAHLLGAAREALAQPTVATTGGPAATALRAALALQPGRVADPWFRERFLHAVQTALDTSLARA